MMDAQSPQLFSADIEKCVLGAFMVDDGSFFQVADRLTSEAFYFKDHRIIFEIIRDLSLTYKKPKPTLVAIKIKEKLSADAKTLLGAMTHYYKDLDDKGGVQVVDDVDELIRLQGLRMVMDAQSSMSKAMMVGADPLELSEQLMGKLTDITALGSRVTRHSMSQVVDNIMRVADNAVSSGGCGIRTGLASVDEKIGGFYPGDLILMGATSGGGKTSLMTQVVVDNGQVGNNSGFFELEMDHVSQMMRMMAGMAGTSTRAILSGKIDETKYAELGRAGQQLRNLPIEIIDAPKQSILQIETVARSLHKQGKLDFMVVDHARLVRRPGKGRRDPVQDVYDTAEDLKALAKNLSIPIVLLCQLTRLSQQSGELRPSMNDFFGGGIENHADLMMICADRYQYMMDNPPTHGSEKKLNEHFTEAAHHKGKKEIHIVKDRRGPSGTRVKVQWVGSKTRFYDLNENASQESFF